MEDYIGVITNKTAILFAAAAGQVPGLAMHPIAFVGDA